MFSILQAPARSFLVFVGTIAALMIGMLWNESVWVWINGDEEEDTVRFRQRLCFVIFWLACVGLFQIRQSVMCNIRYTRLCAEFYIYSFLSQTVLIHAVELALFLFS